MLASERDVPRLPHAHRPLFLTLHCILRHLEHVIPGNVRRRVITDNATHFDVLLILVASSVCECDILPDWS